MADSVDIRIVLVNPSHPGNVGAAARAMKNMGLSQLVLVDPQEFPDPRAIWRAAGAKDLVDAAQVVSSVEEAIADCHLVIGTSARERRIPWPLVNPRQCVEKIYAEPVHSKVAILFGREDSGLTNDELQMCHLHVNVPTSSAYRSLNLAMAVQILCYEIRMKALEVEKNTEALCLDEQWDEPIASVQDTERFFEHLFAALADLEFYDPEQPRQLLVRLRRLFSRIRMDQMEVNILRGILTEMQKKLKK